MGKRCSLVHPTSCMNVPRIKNWRDGLSAEVMVMVMVMAQDREAQSL